MILAEVTLDGDWSTCAWQGVLFLLLLGGVLFFLCYLVGGQSSITSGAHRGERLGPDLDGPSTASQSALDSLTPTPRVQNPNAHRDKRSSLRRGGNPVAVFVSDVEAPGKSVQGRVLNRSRGGLCLSVPQAVEVGRVLAVRTSDYPEGLESVQVRVRHCQPKGASCRLGCQFLETHPWSVLLLFG
jgi:hypothetical protein